MATKKLDLSAFARNGVLKAFDVLAEKFPTVEGTPPTPLQRLADSWRTLDEEGRERIATQVAETAAIALPAVISAAKRRAARRRPAAAPKAAATAEAAPAKETKQEKKDKKKLKKEEKKREKKEKKKKK